MDVTDSVSGTIKGTYDGLDRLTSETTPQGAVDYTYDAAGRRVAMSLAGQADITYSYDEANRLTGITQAASDVRIVYDVLGRRATLTLPNAVIAEYEYDNASNLTGLTYRQGGVTIGNLVYGYDAYGRRTSVSGSLARTLTAAESNQIYI